MTLTISPPRGYVIRAANRNVLNFLIRTTAAQHYVYQMEMQGPPIRYSFVWARMSHTETLLVLQVHLGPDIYM
jgi:hypothetical protein